MSYTHKIGELDKYDIEGPIDNLINKLCEYRDNAAKKKLKNVRVEYVEYEDWPSSYDGEREMSWKFLITGHKDER